jgi:hypothetical protein
MARESIVCTPTGLLEGVIPAQDCLQCMSHSQLLSILALILCKMNGGADADCSPATLAEDAACFECMSDHQMLVALVNLFVTYAINVNDLEEGDLRQEAVCLNCLPPKMIRAIILQQLCVFMAAQEAEQQPQ